jgi:galactokinase
MLDPRTERIRDAFRKHFGREQWLVRSPGRVNLIGEHTDYNQGFVLPGAIDKAIFLALRSRPDRRCRFFAADLGQAHETSLDRLARTDPGWQNYLSGVLSEFRGAGHELSGVDCAFGGDVPIGSGLSSSAALECAFAFALDACFGLGLDRMRLAELAQRAENRFVGVACGIMDQVASLRSRSQALMRLDCRDLSFVYVPFPQQDVRIVLCDTQVRRSLAGSEYNDRRAQCEAAVTLIGRHHPEVGSLRDVTPDLLAEHRDRLDPIVFRRAAYVVAENQRVLAAADALERGDLRACGELMNQSHAGLSTEYEVSCPELDILQAAAVTCSGVLGSRMMGAGFGGCTINLVLEDAVLDFTAQLGEVFRRELRKDPVVHVCQLTGGSEILYHATGSAYSA